MLPRRIENLEQSNEGVYVCRASSAYGQAQDTARLTIQGLFLQTAAVVSNPFVEPRPHDTRLLD